MTDNETKQSCVGVALGKESTKAPVPLMIDYEMQFVPDCVH